MNNDFQVILVDGSSYLFRAFHALPPLENSKGQATGAIKGVISMIRKLQAEFYESQLIVIFDAKGKTFRNDIYTDYKANRPPMPEELRSQIEPIHRIVECLGIPLLCVEGVEADDVIGTLARQLDDAGKRTLISTGDKDMAQLVNDQIVLINTMNGQYMDVDGVKEKFGVNPDQIIDYLALMGDTSDNIPGVPKCGPKTAVKWLTEFDSLTGVMANADQVKGKVGENLRASLEFLPMSYDLATIRQHLELPKKIDELEQADRDLEGLQKYYLEYEFAGWLEELGSPATVMAPVPVAHYEVILDEVHFKAWLNKLNAAPYFSFDTETTGLDYINAELVGISFCCKPGEAAYLPIGHDYLGAPKQLPLAIVIPAIKELLGNEQKWIIGQNFKFDMSVLARYGVEVRAQVHDTMLESYVLNSVFSRHNMDDLAANYLRRKTTHFTDIAGKGAKQLTFNQISIEVAADYAAEDADITLQLHETLWPELRQTNQLMSVFLDIEMPLVPILSTVERTGVLVDAEMLHKQSQEIALRLTELEAEAFDLAGETFNLGSPKQLQQIFYEKLKLPILKKTPKGQPSTAEAVLQELALDYPLPKLIIAYRGLSKLKSTYTDQLPKQINTTTGRVHTSYHQAVAATGRLSSSDPNLQNIPIRTEQGRRIRKAFVANPGYLLVAADYSQIELRIMAHLSSDSGLTQAFKKGLDIHKATAAEVFGCSLEQVSMDQRRSAKAINFGLIYGMSAFGLARQLGISRGDAQDYINLYFERYPGVRDYMDAIKKQAASLGYVETHFGRRLYLPAINSTNFQLRQAAERTAINAPMQGTAADIIKLAMIQVQNWLQESQLRSKMIMQVHDELVLEVVEAELEEVKAGLLQHMVSAADLTIPLEVEVGVGKDWEEAH